MPKLPPSSHRILSQCLMSRVGFKSVVFHGDSCLGEAEIFPTKDPKFRFPNNEIRITHLSPSSERCPPLSILQTISPFAVPCKLESKSLPLNYLHASCFEDLKVFYFLLLLLLPFLCANWPLFCPNFQILSFYFWVLVFRLGS